MILQKMDMDGKLITSNQFQKVGAMSYETFSLYIGRTIEGRETIILHQIIVLYQLSDIN